MQRQDSDSSMRSESGRKDFQGYEQATASKRLYVNGLTGQKEEQIKDWFSKCGKIVDFVLNRKESQEGKDISYCFVELDTLTSAAEAIKELHGKRMGKRMLNVRYARSRTNFTGDRGSMKKSFKNEREDSQSSYRDRSRDRDRDSGRSRGQNRMYCERCKRDLKESAPRSRKMRDEREDAKYSRANETMNTSTTSQHSKSMDMEIDY